MMKNKILTYIMMILLVPPAGWVLTCRYSDLWTTEEMMIIALSPQLSVYVLFFTISVMIYSVKVLNFIDENQFSIEKTTIDRIQNHIGRLPVFLMVIFGVYCIFGPMEAMLNKDFIDKTEWIICELMGIPFILLFSLPFILLIIYSLESWMSHIPLPKQRNVISFSARLYLGSGVTIIGLIICIILIMIGIIYKNQGDPYLYQLVFKRSIPIAVIGMGIGILNITVINRNINKSISSIVRSSDLISKGQININALAMHSRDEIGFLVASINTMIESLKYKGHIIKQISEKNLDLRTNISQHDELGMYLKGMHTSLNDILSDVKNSIDMVSNGIQYVADTSLSLSQGANQQAASIEEITSHITEINSQSEQNAENADQVYVFSKESKERAEKGVFEIQNLDKAMKEIRNSFNEIVKITRIIDEIAFQINILALNATVEAARAGKYGKGFAVVAQEVKNLAARSAKSAEQTNKVIENSIANLEKGFVIFEKTAEQLEDIYSSTVKVLELSRDIRTASRQQTEGLNHTGTGIAEIEQVTHSNAASSQQLASSAEEISRQAKGLMNTINLFTLKKDDHLPDMREILSETYVKQMKG